MYTIGFIKTERPDVLINPDSTRTIEELYTWLTTFLNKDDFSLDPSITLERLRDALKLDRPILVNITGYQVALLLGEDNIIQEATTRYIHLVPRSPGDYPVSRIENLTIPD